MRGWAAVVLMGMATGALAAERPLPQADAGALVREGNVCAITFDDGPGRHTGKLLDLLAERNVKATFFVLGEKALAHPELVERMLAEGHQVENHSFTHPDMNTIDAGERVQQIRETQWVLEELGARPRYFRPPYGRYDQALVGEVQKLGLELMLWSRDSRDWKDRTTSHIKSNILKGGGGETDGVYLFHDIRSTTVEAMPAVLDELTTRGCRFVSLTQWADASAREQRQRVGGLAVAKVKPAARPVPAAGVGREERIAALRQLEEEGELEEGRGRVDSREVQAPPPSRPAAGSGNRREAIPVVAVMDSPPPSRPAVWYYCAAARGYYPEVASCPQGWQLVADGEHRQEGQAASRTVSRSMPIWHYCSSAQSYYPAVESCAEGWRVVFTPSVAGARP